MLIIYIVVFKVVYISKYVFDNWFSVIGNLFLEK